MSAASGDLRNVIKTINDLPQTYTSSISVTINDRDERIVLRNLTMLLLLLHDDEKCAADTIIHLWYSARLKSAHMDLVRKYVQAFIDDVVCKSKEGEAGKRYRKTIELGQGTIRLEFKKEDWHLLSDILSREHNSQETESHRRRITLTGKDNIDCRLFTIRDQSHRRLSKLQYRERGLPLPFGEADTAFTSVNP